MKASADDQPIRRPLPLLPILFSGAVLLAAGPAPERADEDRATAAPSWTVEDCSACHEDQVLAMTRSAHLDHTAEELGDLDANVVCGSCHGDVIRHVEADGEIFSFGRDAGVIAESSACLDCHGDAHPRFLRTGHAQAGISCSGCHDIHRPTAFATSLLAVRSEREGEADEGWDRLGDGSRVCRECHGDVFAEFDLNERHRLQEGILDCSSCHDPHTPQTRLHLGGFEQQACVDCHADKGGPFVFEHGSVMVDGCTSCHTPHGSVNRRMLVTQSVADLCYSCHSGVPGFHVRFTEETVCTNCHSAIHGSNLHAAYLE